MMDSKDCLRAAWNALLKGDLDARDRYCDMAEDLLRRGERIREHGPSAVIEGEFIEVPNVIYLPDYSNKTSQ
jgi:hypothetical protein